jgi:glycosyltransferase involved in cell wall biosynthesis
MSLRILLINETPVPTDERAWLEARSLAEAGHEVTVVCPWPDPAADRVHVLEGVTIRTYRPPAQANGVLGYMWEFSYCWARSFATALGQLGRGGFDVIHACNPPDTFFLLGAIFKPFGKRYVFAQHDLCPELWLSRFGAEVALTSRKSRLLHRGLLFLERMSYRVADRVVVPNESYKATARERGGLGDEDVVVIRNGPDLAKVRIVEPDPSLRRGREHLVCYLGIMNPQDGIEYLLDAAAYMIRERGRDDVQFALVGTGDSIDELERRAEALGIAEHLTFTGWISDSDLLSAYLSTADVCVAPDPRTPLNEKSSFMKIMDYMAVAKPIVAFDLPETKVSAGASALYATPNDTSEFGDKVISLLDDPGARAEMGALGRQRVEDELEWEHWARRLVAMYDELARTAARAGVREAKAFASPDEQA